MSSEIKEKCEMKMPNIGEIDFKTASMNQLCKEFMNLWEANKVKDVHDFMKMLRSLGYEDAFSAVNKNREPFR